MTDSTRYPRTIEIKDGNASLELMTAAAEDEVLKANAHTDRILYSSTEGGKPTSVFRSRL